jgi:hypothetical protein
MVQINYQSQKNTVRNVANACNYVAPLYNIDNQIYKNESK